MDFPNQVGDRRDQDALCPADARVPAGRRDAPCAGSDTPQPALLVHARRLRAGESCAGSAVMRCWPPRGQHGPVCCARLMGAPGTRTTRLMTHPLLCGGTWRNLGSTRPVSRSVLIFCQLWLCSQVRGCLLSLWRAIFHVLVQTLHAEPVQAERLRQPLAAKQPRYKKNVRCCMQARGRACVAVPVRQTTGD